jgi:hypothetical protein
MRWEAHLPLQFLQRHHQECGLLVWEVVVETTLRHIGRQADLFYRHSDEALENEEGSSSFE